MAYSVEVAYLPVNELLLSMHVFLDRFTRRSLELKPNWAAGVREALPLGFEAEYKALMATANIPLHTLAAVVSPARESVPAFLEWLEATSIGEIYEAVAPYLPEGSTLPTDWGTARVSLVRLIRAWDEAYFRHLDPLVLQTLSADAESRRAFMGATPPVEFVEQTTGGMVLETDGEERVLLIPQYHFRPLNMIERLRGLVILAYPVDLPPAHPDTPPTQLMRLTRGLADESRLRVLRFLARGERSFTEIVEATGLAKSTVHHHMSTLRAAGLVRIHFPSDRYSLRQDAIDHLGTRLVDFLKGE